MAWCPVAVVVGNLLFGHRQCLADSNVAVDDGAGVSIKGLAHGHLGCLDAKLLQNLPPVFGIHRSNLCFGEEAQLLGCVECLMAQRLLVGAAFEVEAPGQLDLKGAIGAEGE